MESGSNSAEIFLGAIARAQRSFFQGQTAAAFQTLLSAALEGTGSEIGFLGEVNYSLNAEPIMDPLACLRRTAAGEESLALPRGELTPLFQRILASEKPVLLGAGNEPAGRSLGDTPLRSFLGIPLKMNGAMVGVLGLGNRPVYGADEIRLVEDFKQVCGSMVVAATQQRLKERAEQSRRLSEHRLNAIVQSMAEGLVTADDAGTIQSANAAAEHFFGFTERELIGRNLGQVLTPGGQTEKLDVKKMLSRGKNEHRREALGKKRDGSLFPVELTVSPIGSVGPDPATFVVLIRDITNRKRQEEALYILQEKLLIANEKLAHSADTDALTGVSNRRYFDERFPEEINRIVRTGRYFCLFILDVDFFKNYNDHYGHQRGDECLKTVAHATAGALNRAGEFLARIGGEEFAGVLSGTMDSPSEYQRRLQTIIDRIRKLAILHDGSSVSPFVTVSAGAIAFQPEPGCDPEWVMGLADRALYRAKQTGRDRVVFAQTSDVELV